MSRHVIVESVGPAVSIQDAGRFGGLGLGLSRGGAVDRRAYLEACALLAAPLGSAVLELAGFGGRFRFSSTTRFALSGAPMRATLDGQPLEWGASHLAGPGAVLDIGAAEGGVYGYLGFGGGIETGIELGGRGFHRIAGLGRAVGQLDQLPLGADCAADRAPVRLGVRQVETGEIRVMPGPQTEFFSDQVREAFAETRFVRSPKANRQGVRLDHDGAPFATEGQLNQVSDFISEGDVQMTGDGTPYVLLADCQTMGGYPRIGTVMPIDLPRVAQSLPGESLQFSFVTLDEAEALWQSDEAVLAEVARTLEPRVRDPREMSDLLAYDLIGKPIGITGDGEGDELRHGVRDGK